MIRGLATLILALGVAACGAAAVPPAAVPASGAPAASALPAGTYSSSSFQPAVTFTVPAGWEVAADAPAYFLLRPVGDDLAGIHFFRGVSAASQDLACPTTAAPGVGTTSSELVAWMRGLKGLAVAPPTMATVGGLQGVSVDIGIASGWTTSCPFANGVPTVPLLTNGADLRWVMAGSERLRLYLLDLPAGGTVIVDVDAFDGSLFDGLIKDALPIVRTLRFAGG